jgi:serine/threonine protein kinase
VTKDVLKADYVALKQPHPNMTGDDYKAFLKEIQNMEFVGSHKHKHIVEFYGCTTHPSTGKFPSPMFCVTENSCRSSLHVSRPSTNCYGILFVGKHQKIP